MPTNPTFLSVRGASTVRTRLAAAVALLCLQPLGLAADEGGKGITGNIGPYKAEFMIGASAMGAKALVGHNEIMVRLRDAGDKPVSDASLKLGIAMDKGSTMSMDMGDEKAIEVKLVADGSMPGDYTGAVTLDFDGKWIATMELAGGDMAERADFAFEAAKAGPNWVILGGFGLVFALIIVGAALLRPKKPGNGGSAA